VTDASQEDDITNHPAYPKAMARAMRLINYRERSAHELCKRLQEDQYPPELVEAVLVKVQHMVGWLCALMRIRHQQHVTACAHTSAPRQCMQPVTYICPNHTRVSISAHPVEPATVADDDTCCCTLLQGLQDDARFAEMYAWGRWRAKSLSPNRIKHVGAPGKQAAAVTPMPTAAPQAVHVMTPACLGFKLPVIP
jgi:hypothetical protein